MPDQIEGQKETGPSPPPQGPVIVPGGDETKGNRQQVPRQREPRPPRRDQRQQRKPPEGGQRDEATKVSVVVPLLNEEQSLRELFDSLRNVLNRMGKYEIVFVDDGSTDGSARVLQELRQRDRRVKIIRFRRNYGKSAALSVGFHHARGEFVITMDADLQDDPQEIPNILNELKKGFDLVSGWKRKRFDPITKTVPSRFFNFVTSLLTGIRLHDFNCGLKGYRREVVKELKLYGELHRYIPVLARWQGYKITEVVVRHHPRKFGKTKFGMGRFWKGFLDLLTVLFTTRYMQRPLHLFGFWGLLLFIAGFAIDLYLGIMKFTEGVVLSNRPLFLGGVLLIIVGVQIISLGLLGELITKLAQKGETEYSIKEVWK